MTIPEMVVTDVVSKRFFRGLRDQIVSFVEMEVRWQTECEASGNENALLAHYNGADHLALILDIIEAGLGRLDRSEKWREERV